MAHNTRKVKQFVYCSVFIRIYTYINSMNARGNLEASPIVHWCLRLITCWGFSFHFQARMYAEVFNSVLPLVRPHSGKFLTLLRDLQQVTTATPQRKVLAKHLWHIFHYVEIVVPSQKCQPEAQVSCGNSRKLRWKCHHNNAMLITETR